MNKKLLFGIMSLAALTACTNDDFENKSVAQQEVSPVQFEVINDAFTRASMSGNKVVFSATDGDLFTLYHGGNIAGDGQPLTAYENATYKASSGEGGAVLTTPTMIKQGKAIMTWPADTVFRANGNLSIVIPQNQTDKIQYEIPYVSDVIDIQAYAAYTETAPATAYNTAGKDRKYSVYMRPMASQLNLKAEYNGTDETLAALEAGEDGIEPIEVTSIELLTTPGGGGTTNFTTEIPLKFTTAANYAPAVEALPTAGIQAMWNAADAHNAWSHVTCFDVASIVAAGQVDKLTTTYLDGNAGAKFLILPQAAIAGGVDDPGVIVNTIYGKVVIADPDNGNPHNTKYSTTEYNNAWYRYLPSAQKIAVATAEENVSAATAETTGDNRGLYKTVAKNLSLGMQQTINYMSTYEAKASLPAIQSEPLGVALTRYVNVNLGHLDMSELHVKDDKQLRDAAKVWKQMGLDDVTVYLDGGKKGNPAGEFKISQTTIAKINEINATAGGAKSFKVKPCQVAGEVCNTIVITGGGDVPNITFFAANGGFKADVALNAGETWNWKGTNTAALATKIVKIPAAGVAKMINRGTMVNSATATLATYEADGTQNNIPFENANGAIWSISAGTKLNVQFDVTNKGTVNIAADAQYRMDGLTQNVKFDNEAETLPRRILDVVSPATAEIVGKVNNEGVFATVAAAGKTAVINNYGLIEHKSLAAKTYVTTNQLTGNFAAAFDPTVGTGNKMGMINFPWECKAAENVSISNALNTGFVAVTVNGEVTGALDAGDVGTKVNYVIIKNGVTQINRVAGTVKYLEINQPGTEIAWKTSETGTYTGLTILSDVNITQGTNVTVTGATFLGADMYVGGAFTNASWSGYYGDTSAKFATNYITY